MTDLAKHRNPLKGSPGEGLDLIVGRFETNGAAAPINGVGKGWTAHRTGAGLIKVTLDQRYKSIVAIFDALWQGTGGNDELAIDPATVTGGSSTAPASFTIETQSSAGTKADLDGPVVCFEVWATLKTPGAPALTSA